MKKKAVKIPLPPYYEEPSIDSVVSQVASIIREKTKFHCSAIDLNLCTQVATHLKGWDILRNPEAEKAHTILEKQNSAMMKALLRLEAYWIEKKLTKEEEAIFSQVITSKGSGIFEPLFKEKTKTDLDAMSTKNLLAYYQAERKRFYQAEDRVKRNPRTASSIFTINVKIAELEKWQCYLGVLKRMLDSREHVA